MPHGVQEHAGAAKVVALMKRYGFKNVKLLVSSIYLYSQMVDPSVLRTSNNWETRFKQVDSWNALRDIIRNDSENPSSWRAESKAP